MSDTPMQVLTRPFAIEPVTGMMLPDGIFDNAIYQLQIACHFTNQSGAALTNVELYLESVGDPGIVPVANTFTFASVPAGASILVQWNADFQFATPGKRLVSFIAKADGFTSRRSIQQIFVSQTRFNNATNTYTCTVEEGTLTVSKISAIIQAPTWQAGSTADGSKCLCPPKGGPWIPTGVTLDWAANPAYAGVHGDLPFSDPWWKILALIVALIAAIVAVIAAVTGHGTASAGASGTFDETQPNVHCCTPSSGGDAGDGIAGAASAVAVAALCVALSDAADPFWRGQENTVPAAGELTTGEKVVAKWSLPVAPNAGQPYTADVKWTYTRFTTGNTYTHSVSETQTNIHVSDGVEIDTPATVHAFSPLWVKSKFHKTGADLFKGNELYAFALFRAPQGLFFVVPLTDDGLGFDPAANDGIFAGSLDLERAYKLLLRNHQDVYGVWRVFVFAQDVNLTKPGTPPEIAAQHIGGFFVASAISITFDPSLPCPLKAQASITVV
ncbi:MAG TPA: choice-of-anchor X domain-containing protein [Edaphobacter sp.]|nr:choice-of-anchor X domain-containing protein [Edaphobacter sp.]